jgi:hypothetical protein
MPEESHEMSAAEWTRWWVKHQYVNWLWRWFVALLEYLLESIVIETARFVGSIPTDLHFFLLIKLQNGIPPIRDDSTAPAIYLTCGAVPLALLSMS